MGVCVRAVALTVVIACIIVMAMVVSMMRVMRMAVPSWVRGILSQRLAYPGA